LKLNNLLALISTNNENLSKVLRNLQHWQKSIQASTTSIHIYSLLTSTEHAIVCWWTDTHEELFYHIWFTSSHERFATLCNLWIVYGSKVDKWYCTFLAFSDALPAALTAEEKLVRKANNCHQAEHIHRIHSSSSERVIGTALSSGARTMS